MTHILVETSEGRYATDLFSHLITNTFTVPIYGQVTHEMAAKFKATMLFLCSKDPEREIVCHIDSPGGSVVAGTSMRDMMTFVKNPICTIANGQAASMGAFLLAAGDKGRRFSLPSSQIMIHQPLGGCEGQASDIMIQAREIEKVKNRLNSDLSMYTGQPFEKVELDTDRDNHMTPEQALEYGLIDKVLCTMDDMEDYETFKARQQK